MPAVVRLRLEHQPGGDLLVSVDDLRSAPVTATVPAVHASRVESDVERALIDAAAATRWRESVGRAMATAFSTHRTITDHLGFLLGPTTGIASRPVLAIAADGALAKWPWELVSATAETAPVEHTRRASVVRLAPGPGGSVLQEPAHRLRVVTFCPSPGDGDNAARLAAVEASLRGRAGDVLEVGSLLDAPPASADRPVATVLHLIVGDDTGVIGHLAGDSRAGSTAVAASWLRGVDLVVLDVVGAATDALDWARRVVAAGAPACVAPVGPMARPASELLSEVLYPALVEGRSLADAVAVVRAEQGRRSPAPTWYALFAGNPEVLTRVALVARRWRPEGWPVPAPDSARLLERAHELAALSGSGFVGLEHVTLALVDQPDLSSFASSIRDLARLRGDTVRQRLSALVPSTDRAPDWRGTPRLRAYGPLLERGFDVDDLWSIIASDRSHALHDALGRDLAALPGAPSLAPVEWGDPKGGALLVQLASGPEDGLVLKPEPGDVLGRYCDGVRVPLALYTDTLLVDRRLSRRHLKWIGGGRILAVRPLNIRRGTNDLVVPGGETTVEAGDLVRLSRGTRFSVLRG
jgi:hypothetical protein